MVACGNAFKIEKFYLLILGVLIIFVSIAGIATAEVYQLRDESNKVDVPRPDSENEI